MKKVIYLLLINLLAINLKAQKRIVVYKDKNGHISINKDFIVQDSKIAEKCINIHKINNAYYKNVFNFQLPIFNFYETILKDLNFQEIAPADSNKYCIRIYPAIDRRTGEYQNRQLYLIFRGDIMVANYNHSLIKDIIYTFKDGVFQKSIEDIKTLSQHSQNYLDDYRPSRLNVFKSVFFTMKDYYKVLNNMEITDGSIEDKGYGINFSTCTDNFSADKRALFFVLKAYGKEKLFDNYYDNMDMCPPKNCSPINEDLKK